MLISIFWYVTDQKQMVIKVYLPICHLSIYQSIYLSSIYHADRNLLRLFYKTSRTELE